MYIKLLTSYIFVLCYKVLVAVEQGESLVKALEEAVPEDVRGKLTASVTEILQSKRETFSLDALNRLGWNNVRPIATKTLAQEKLKDSDHERGLKDANMVDQNRISATACEGDQKDINMTNADKPAEGIKSSQGKPSYTSEPVGTATEIGNEQPYKSDKPNYGTNDSSEGQHITEQDNGMTPMQVSDDQSVANSNGASKEREQSADATTDQNLQASTAEKEGDTIRTGEDKAAHNVNDQSTQVSKTEELKPPPITVTQALDALTGFDDSTQMAVNSVFGVLENMIDQFQKQQDSENGENADGNDDVTSVDGAESHVKENTGNASSGEDINHSSKQPEGSSPGKSDSIMSKDDCAFGEGNPNLSIVSSSRGKMRYYRGNKVGDHVDADGIKQVSGLPDYLFDIAVNSYLKAQYAMYLREFVYTQLQLKSPESNSATDLFLDPQEGKWKIADQMDNVQNNISESSRESSKMDNAVEPPYFIPGKFPDFTYKSNKWNNTVATSSKPGNDLREALTHFIRDELSSALKIEVGRKIGITDTGQLERSLANDVEQIAAEVSKTVVLDSELYLAIRVQGSPTTIKFGSTHGNDVVEAVSTAVQQSQHLRNILPVGVIVGVTLACLRNYFHVGVKHGDHMKATMKSDIFVEEVIVQDSSKENVQDSGKANRDDNNIEKTSGDNQQEMTKSQGQGMMVGAVTAALGASALVAHNQVSKLISHLHFLVYDFLWTCYSIVYIIILLYLFPKFLLSCLRLAG